MKIRTSGSTGVPKEIELPEEDLIISAQATNEFFGINENSVLACALSREYIAGIMMEFRAKTARCRCLMVKPSNKPFAEYDFSGIPSIDLMAAVPSQIPGILENSELAKRIKNIIVGGAPLDRALEELLIETGINGFVTFGMTETASHIALRPIGTQNYNALADISFDADENGRLIIRSTKRSFRELLTNDVVELVSDKEFVWKGRFDNVVNSGGVKLYPEMIEKKVEPVIGCKFYFVGVPSMKWGEELALVLEDGSCEIKDDVLYEILRSVLSPYEIPKSIRHVSAIEYTANGKIKRKIVGK